MNSVPAYVYYGSLADVKLVSRRVHYVPTGDMRAIDPTQIRGRLSYTCTKSNRPRIDR